MPPPGVEPGPRPSQSRVPPSHSGDEIVITIANTLARNRTWSTTFEASHANPAHSEGHSRAGTRGVEPRCAGFGGPPLSREHIPKSIRKPSGKGGIRTLTPQGAHWLATRPGQPYPAPFHARNHRVDRRGVEPRLPVCRTGVFPFDQQPKNTDSHTSENRPGRTRTCAILFVRQASWPLDDGTNEHESPRWESNPHAPPSQDGGFAYLPTRRSDSRIPGPGIEPGNPGL